MRLIDTDRLLEDKKIEKYYHLKNGDVAIPLIDIKHAPTIEERKKGKWIPHNEENPLDGSRGGVTCSNCGWKTHNKMHLLMGCSYRFCPNCGYRMGGESNGENSNKTQKRV